MNTEKRGRQQRRKAATKEDSKEGSKEGSKEKEGGQGRQQGRKQGRKKGRKVEKRVTSTINNTMLRSTTKQRQNFHYPKNNNKNPQPRVPLKLAHSSKQNTQRAEEKSNLPFETRPGRLGSCPCPCRLHWPSPLYKHAQVRRRRKSKGLRE
jgi:hypothetical protein